MSDTFRTNKIKANCIVDFNDVGYSKKGHTHTIGEVTNLRSCLNNRALLNHTHGCYSLKTHTHDCYVLRGELPGAGEIGPHTHEINDINGLDSALDGKACKNHTHDGYALSGHVHDNYALKSHEHKIADIDNLRECLAGKSDVGHTHDYWYWHVHSIDEVSGLQACLDNKACVNHLHKIADICNLQTCLNNKACKCHTHDWTGIDIDIDLSAYLTIVNAELTYAKLCHTHDADQVYWNNPLCGAGWCKPVSEWLEWLYSQYLCNITHCHASCYISHTGEWECGEYSGTLSNLIGCIDKRFERMVYADKVAYDGPWECYSDGFTGTLKDLGGKIDERFKKLGCITACKVQFTGPWNDCSYDGSLHTLIGKIDSRFSCLEQCLLSCKVQHSGPWNNSYFSGNLYSLICSVDNRFKCINCKLGCNNGLTACQVLFGGCIDTEGWELCKTVHCNVNDALNVINCKVDKLTSWFLSHEHPACSEMTYGQKLASATYTGLSTDYSSLSNETFNGVGVYQINNNKPMRKLVRLVAQMLPPESIQNIIKLEQTSEGHYTPIKVICGNAEEEFQVPILGGSIVAEYYLNAGESLTIKVEEPIGLGPNSISKPNIVAYKYNVY